MLRQEELAFTKAISTMLLSQAKLKELRIVMSRRQKTPAVIAGSLMAGSDESPELANSLALRLPASRRWGSGPTCRYGASDPYMHRRLLLSV